jgi:hypothetical protein
VKEVFEQLLRDGEPALELMVLNKEEETLHREFKTAAGDRGTKLTRDDKRNIAKALSGFSNAEDGILIIGIETATENNLDIAANLRPIVDLNSYYNRVLSYVHDAISPQSTGIRVEAIRSSKQGDIGYIAVLVPASDLRPHMSNAEHRYFRRGSDGTRTMEHGEVRDLMLAARQGRLELRPLFESSGSGGGDIFLVKVFLALENIGRVPVSAPFINIQGGLFQPASPDLILRSMDNGVGIYARRDTLVHVEDTMKMGVVDVAFKMYDRDQYAKEVPAMQADYINSFADTQLFTIKLWNLSMAALPWNKTDIMPSLHVRFGAENAPIETLDPHYSKIEWFRHLARAARLLTE